MKSPARQKFLDVDGEDVPVAFAPENQQQNPAGESNKDRLDNALNAPIGDTFLPPSPSGIPLPLTRKPPDMKRVRGKRRSERTRRAERREQTSKQLRKAEKRSPSESVTFAPADDDRVKMVKLLLRKGRSRERTSLEQTLTREFLRIYKRRRRVVQCNYQTMDAELKHATQAARLCIIKSVTPTQLLDYWEEHVGDFTGMRFPALNFLAIAGNVDRVSVEVAIPGGPRKKRKRKRRDAPEVHAYSGDLDPRLRPGLVEAGLIEGTEISDRFLMTVQTTAQAVARGRNLFVSSKLKPMVDWARTHLYAD